MDQNLPQRQINLAEHGTLIRCEKCNGKYFRDVVCVFKVSKLVTATSEDSYVPIKTLACDECGHVNAEFDTKESKPSEQ